MKFTIAAAAALVAGASAQYGNGTVYTTEVVTAYTTYCPAPTQITHGGSTYTVTEATTLTITNCPCTITKPIYSSTPVASPPAAVTSASSAAPAPPAPYVNSTAPIVTPVVPVTSSPSATPVGSATTTGSAPISTGAAGKVVVSGASLAGLLGVAALLL